MGEEEEELLASRARMAAMERIEEEDSDEEEEETAEKMRCLSATSFKRRSVSFLKATLTLFRHFSME